MSRAHLRARTRVPPLARLSWAAARAAEAGLVVVLEDELGPLPRGWVKQTDAEGDSWFYNSKTQETSWIRPNADGSVPTA